MRNSAWFIASFSAAVAAIVLSGCGGGSSSSSTSSTAAPMAAATAMATTEAQREQGALPLAQAAPIPADLTCKGAIVWVNMSRHTYHEAGDPYYGRTKNGQYMCRAAAIAAGDHAAGKRHSHMGTMAPSDMATAAATP